MQTNGLGVKRRPISPGHHLVDWNALTVLTHITTLAKTLIEPIGTLTELTASGAPTGTVRVPDTDGPAGTLQRLWQNSSDWGLPLGIGAAALFFLLLIRASRVRRRGN